MRRKPFPGKMTERLLMFLLRTPRQDEIVGDLIEEARTRIMPSGGRMRAHFWLLKEALRSVPSLFGEDPLRGGMGEGIGGDFRFALRTLRNRPLFAFLTVLTLGVGIGAPTAMFSVVDGILLKSLPYQDPGRLVSLWKVHRDWRGQPEIGERWDRGLINLREFRSWREGNTHFENVAAYQGTWRAFTGRDGATLLSVGEATASLIPTLGVTMHLGRWFSASEEATAGEDDSSVAVLSHGFWERVYGADEGVLGTGIVLHGQAYTIVGVLPADFRLRLLEKSDPGSREVWVPVGVNYLPGSGAENSGDWETVGRLAAGAGIESAEAEALSLLRGDRDPETYDFRLSPRMEGEARGLTSPLVLLLGATAVLLLIGCGNASMLLLGEMEGREHELATRAALGAGRGRILRQLVTEGAVLGLLGAGVGALLAVVGTRGLVDLAPALPRMDRVLIDFRALTVCTLLGLGTGIGFAVIPALLSSRRSPAGSLGRSARAGGGRRRSVSRGVVVGQATLTVVLLVMGGLLVRNLERVTSTDPGFNPEGVATVKVTVPLFAYGSAEEVLRFLEEATREIEAIPGVESVGAVFPVPFSGDAESRTMSIDPDSPGGGRRVEVMRSVVTPGYWETMGLPLMEGRELTVQDGRGSPEVAVVSESFARMHWPGESAVGQTIGNVGVPSSIRVVGVVGDVLRESFRIQPEPTFYVPLAQVLRLRFNFVARTRDDPEDLVSAMTVAVGSAGPSAPLTEGETLSSLMARSTRGQRFSSLLMRIFGVMAAILAATGVFGVTARQIAQSQREMGIRLALGAEAPGLVGRVVSAGLAPAGMGTALGLIMALGSARLLGGFLFEFDSFEPMVYLSAGGTLLGVCSLAIVVPALRITRVDPATVLREE